MRSKLHVSDYDNYHVLDNYDDFTVEPSLKCKLTFTQEDCEAVDHWRVYVNGEYLISVAPSCADTMNTIVTVFGTGSKTFGMKAVAVDGRQSEMSNEIQLP